MTRRCDCRGCTSSLGFPCWYEADLKNSLKEIRARSLTKERLEMLLKIESMIIDNQDVGAAWLAACLLDVVKNYYKKEAAK